MRVPAMCNARCPVLTIGDLCTWVCLQWYPKMQPVWKDGDMKAEEYHHLANVDLERQEAKGQDLLSNVSQESVYKHLSVHRVII